MKKFIGLIILPFLINNAYGHAQGPNQWGGADNVLESTTMDGQVTVPIMVASSELKKFNIYTDNTLYKTISIQKGKQKKIRVPVYLRKQSGKVEIHRVCSTALNEKINTTICTRVKAVWLK